VDQRTAVAGRVVEHRDAAVDAARKALINQAHQVLEAVELRLHAERSSRVQIANGKDVVMANPVPGVGRPNEPGGAEGRSG